MLTTPTPGCDTAYVKPEPPLTLRKPSALSVTWTVALPAVEGAAPAPVKAAPGDGSGPTRSKGPLRDRLPVKLSMVKVVPEKVLEKVLEKVTDTDSSTVALAVPVAVAAPPSPVRARLPITRAQAPVCQRIFCRNSFFITSLLPGKIRHGPGRVSAQQKIHAGDEFSVGQDGDVTLARIDPVELLELRRRYPQMAAAL